MPSQEELRRIEILRDAPQEILGVIEKHGQMAAYTP